MPILLALVAPAATANAGEIAPPTLAVSPAAIDDDIVVTGTRLVRADIVVAPIRSTAIDLAVVTRGLIASGKADPRSHPDATTDRRLAAEAGRSID